MFQSEISQEKKTSQERKVKRKIHGEVHQVISSSTGQFPPIAYHYFSEVRASNTLAQKRPGGVHDGYQVRLAIQGAARKGQD